MKKGIYLKLALTGVSKNRKMYFPYILTCTGMVMMFYIIYFLSRDTYVASMRGGATMQIMLSLGSGITGIFSVIFLFYTNSFLIRRRKKEFGLYNILGMNKRNLARILFWECLVIAAAALAAGLFLGILLSKAGELILSNILSGAVSFQFYIDGRAVATTIVLFGVIFLLILLNSLRQIHFSNPRELLESDRVGEKPPRANWIAAVLGVLMLGFAYYLTLTIEDPMVAFVIFFGAVALVIVGTYLVFISGSVAFLKILQKNRRYYYKPNHFVSVSSMAYRMKKNGAGLASICILSTMVLVMVSATMCLYVGAENSLRNMYPRDLVVETYSLDEEAEPLVIGAVQEALQEQGASGENILHYHYMASAVMQKGGEICFDPDQINALAAATDMRQLFVVPLADYNRLMGQEETLNEGEALIYVTKGGSFEGETISLDGEESWKIKKQAEGFVQNGIDSQQVIPSIYLFLSDQDFQKAAELYDRMEEKYSESTYSAVNVQHNYYGVDISGGDAVQMRVQKDLEQRLAELAAADEDFPVVMADCVAENRADFYAVYGGIFFLGAILGLVFILGTVLIVYYKQITEGYEDQARFTILKKVGMTGREIRKSINSQVLTVFFLPLIAAGIHTAFAFPMVQKLLLLFGLTDTRLFLLVNVGCFLVFTVFYVAVYVATSRSYYRIVSRPE
ncbi:MAG TPA: FtsX-like permease family protein [Candidatus Scatomonas pullistercoris]|uniref:FtsX-like permease family protein n=1 Tax=Candidatus Scatomonas pullistercoris TaxID=2840920 RepID=A0A9D1P3D9_9FIRM|nr:FtsX-like permease family protein [Candidatus Scatomonas pullistercoris]